MHYAYIRVSTDKQTTETQRFEILKFADAHNLSIDQWIEDTVSGTKKVPDRKLAAAADPPSAGRAHCDRDQSLGRSLMEVMSFLHTLMERNVTVYTIKEGYTLGNTLNSQVLAFAFSLAAELERAMISQRTKEAFARKRSEGKRLGRPKGALSTTTKLTGKAAVIKDLLAQRVGVSASARIRGVHRLTVANHIRSRGL
jgi:DNA invertase Pin-like site-specific DNA recombinase